MSSLRRSFRATTPQTVLWVDYASGRFWLYGERADRFGALVPYPSVASLCDAAVANRATVVELVGERPGGADVFAFGDWYRDTGIDWREDAKQGHYLRDLLVPVLRYAPTDPTDDAYPVTVRSAAEWYGDHSAPRLELVRDAVLLANDVLRSHFRGGRLWVSPQATGTDLLLRALPAGVTYPMMTDEHRAFFQQHSTQGRVETFAGDGDLPALVEYDGRFSYAALCADLPDSEPTFGYGAPDPLEHGYLPGTSPLMMRGKFLARWTVPAGWDGPGILPVLTADGWVWPAHGTHSGWVDGAELHVADKYGWPLELEQHAVFTRPKKHGPLKSWAESLAGARSVAALADPDGLAVDMLRAVLLTTIGVLHGKGHTVTRYAPSADEVPAGRALPNLRPDDAGGWLWDESLGPARPAFAHPEWSTAIWARQRARLLDGPAVRGVRTGALHVLPASLVAFSVDALYLSHDPEWPDDGNTGRLRRKARYLGPFERPRSRSDLLALLRELRTAAA